MSDRGETREQPSIPEPAQLSTEHAFLGLAIATLTAAFSGLVVQVTLHRDLLRGAYSVLAALMVIGVVGYFGVRILRELAGLRAGQGVVRETLRQQPAGGRQVREPVGVGRPHRSSRGGDRSEYWTVYSDVLDDLGGLDDGPTAN